MSSNRWDGTVIGSQTFAASPNGTFYAPESVVQGGYNPERLTIISDDKMIDYTVFNGAKAEKVYEAKIQGNVITISSTDSGDLAFDCNGRNVTYNAHSTSMSAEFERLQNSLIINTAHGKIVFTDSTTDQTEKILALPNCTKK